MSAPDQERLEKNIRRTAGIHALKAIRGIVDEDLREEVVRKKWLAALLRYGWLVLLLAVLLTAYFLGAI